VLHTIIDFSTFARLLIESKQFFIFETDDIEDCCSTAVGDVVANNKSIGISCWN
jgi:hypothetical protein